jgi:1-aminocyclopropane-1-carboxylate deaminase/D-cysteine desulfhydrase-like pyridoxal-dependent ACC family enzyme
MIMTDATAQGRETRLAAAIAALPRLSLGSLNTPIQEMPRLQAALQAPPLYVKRDDLTGLAFGGNKTRMLEFSLADALAQGADTIVTGAAVQSNYCRQMAGACAKLGLELHLILRPEREIDKTQSQGNNLIQRLLGAKVTVLADNNRPKQQEVIRARVEELRAQGRNVYWPRLHDTIDLDALAYAECALEIVRQCREMNIQPKYLYLAALDTTQAGIVLGLKYLGSPIHVRGISPFGDMPGRCQHMAAMANQAAQRLGLEIELSERDFDNDDSYVGERYGLPTQAGLESIKLVAQTEGILLDPVYTGKAMSALIQEIRDGKIAADEPVLFVHTGGAPALFGYAEEVLSVI